MGEFVSFGVPAPRAEHPITITTGEFAVMHDVYVQAGLAEGISDETRAMLGDDLSRYCAAHPEAYSAFLQQQSAEFEASNAVDYVSE